MLELSKIKFGVDTTELDAVTSKIATVIKAVEGLSNAQTRAQVNNSKASRAAQQQAESEAKAKLAELRLEKEKERQAKSTSDAVVKAARANASALELETSKLEFMTRGYSQGQAGKLAYAKAAGVAADEIERLGKVLQDQRKIIGGDPFDKSLGGLKALGNEYSVVKEQMRLYNAQLGLTQKQSEGLARDKLRMIEAAKIEGKSIFGIREQVRLLNAEYIKVASAENALTESFKKNQKATSDAAKATAFLEAEMNKVVFANQELNNSLGRGSSNQLLKFEQALKKTGKTAAEQKIELEKYRIELDKLEKKSGNAKTDHISRALAPQITDIVVGLSTGQSPLTVMLQQGGQLRDQLGMAGIAAADMGMAMRNAMTGMVSSVAAVGKAIGTMLIGGLVDAGAAVKNTAMNMLGLSAATDAAKRYFEGLGSAGMKFAGIMTWVGKAINLAFGVALLTGIGAVIAMGVALVQVVKENDALAKSLALSGGQLGLSQTTALDYVKALSDVGVTTGKATEALVAMAKEGVFTKDSIMMIGQSAAEMSKWAGVSIEDTVKQFAKLKEKPLEGLLELAKATGMVPPEIIKMVAELERSGRAADAAGVAMKALADVQKTQVEQMKENYNGFATFMIELGGKIKSFFSGAFKYLFIASNPTEQLEEKLEMVQRSLAVAKNMPQAIPANRDEVEKLKLIERDMMRRIELTKSNNIQEAEGLKTQSDYAKTQETINELRKKHMTDETKHENELTRLKGLRGEIAKKESITKKEDLAIVDDAIKKEQEALDKARKPKKGPVDPVKKYGLKELNAAKDAMLAADGAAEELTKSQIKLNQIMNDALWAQMPKAMQEEITLHYQLAAAQEQQNAALDLENQLLGKAERLGSDYYDKLKKIEAFGKSGVWSPDKVLEMKEALDQTTPAAKRLAAALAAFEKGGETASKSMRTWADKIAEMAGENYAIRLSVSDASIDEQKYITSEMEKQKNLAEADARFREKTIAAEERLQKVLADGNISPDSSKGKELLEQTTKTIENYKKLADADKSVINENAYLKLIADYAKEIDATAAGAAQSLAALGSTSFGNAINGLNGMVVGLDKLISRQDVFDKMRKDAAGDEVALAKINKMQSQSTLNSYATITGAMKGFFKEGSKGYKAMNAAEKVFRAFEMAMALKSAVTRITAEASVTAAKVSGTATSTAAVASGSILEIAWTKAVNIVKGIGAVLTQGSGDPYTAIPRMAAMAAIVAGLGVMIGGIGGGSSGVQKTNDGTGTVFGDSTAKSESIANSLGILEDVNTLTMQYSAEMAKSLRSIETALTGVTNVILRSAGIETSARGVQAGTVASGFGSTLMKLMDGPGLDPLLGKVINALFGSKTTITGQGVMANDATIQQIQNGGLSAGYYTDVNKKKKFLGITTSDKNSTQFDESDELSRQFASIINGFVDVVKAAGPILGVSLSDIDKSLEGFIVKIGKIDLKDLKGDEIKEKLMAVFGAAGDDIAMQTLKGFEKYQEAGEGYLETITRVASTVENVRGTMDTLNSSMSLTVDGAMELAEAFGGLEAFLQTTSSYLNAYYTDEERKATLARQGSAALKSKGIDIDPQALANLGNAAVRAWVESFENDKELYAWAQNLAVQLAPLYELPKDASDKDTSEKDDNSAEDAAKKALDLKRQGYELDKQYATLIGDENSLKKATLALRVLDLAAMDESLRATQELIWAYEDQKAAIDKVVAANKALNESLNRDVTNAQKASDKAFAALERAVNAEKKKAEEAEKAAEEVKDKLESIFDLLKDSVRELFLEVDSTKKMLASEGRTLIQNAISSGVLPDEKALGDAIGAVRDNLESTKYKTKYESDRARLGFAIELDSLKGTAGEQLTEAEKQLKAAKDQVEYLDKVLETARAELNKLREIDDSVISVEKAITALATALKVEYNTNLAQQQKYLVGTGGALYDKSTETGTNSSGQTFTKQGILDAYNAHMNAGGSLQQAVNVLSGSGYTLNQIEDMFGSTRGSLGAVLDANGVARFAEGGSYMGGLAMVGEEGPELINFNNGGQVYTAAETQRMMGGGSDCSEVRALREEVALLRYEARATAQNTAKLNRNIERLIVVTPDGEALQTKGV